MEGNCGDLKAKSHQDAHRAERQQEQVSEHALSKGYVVHFAVKANFNFKILERIRLAGLGVDCVSGREIERSLEAGFKPEQIAFAGVGKTDNEIRTGLKHNIYSFNCESVQELEVLNKLAGETGTQASVSVRLNPNVEANTHKYITTGLTENKFGINPEKLPLLFDLIPRLENIRLTGIHFHIGSQITDLEPLVKMVKADVDPNGGISLDRDFFVDFGETRAHQVRLEGGDASTDSFCFPS